MREQNFFKRVFGTVLRGTAITFAFLSAFLQVHSGNTNSGQLFSEHTLALGGEAHADAGACGALCGGCGDCGGGAVSDSGGGSSCDDCGCSSGGGCGCGCDSGCSGGDCGGGGGDSGGGGE